MKRSVFIHSLSVATSFFAAACSGGAEEELVERASAAIVGGSPSDSSQNDVVRIEVYDDHSQKRWDCTAGLVNEQLAVTAAHCVVQTTTNAGGVGCEDLLSPRPTDYFGKTVKPENIFVFLGETRKLNVQPDAKVAKLIMVPPPDNHMCGGDIAFMVLDPALPGAVTAELSFDPVKIGDELHYTGWGRMAASQSPLVRQRRDDGMVSVIGPALEKEELIPARFRLGTVPGKMMLVRGENLCRGDSGSPVKNKAGLTVAIDSYGTATCEGDARWTMLTLVYPYRELYKEARNWAEIQPNNPDPISQYPILTPAGRPFTVVPERFSMLSDPPEMLVASVRVRKTDGIPTIYRVARVDRRSGVKLHAHRAQ